MGGASRLTIHAEVSIDNLINLVIAEGNIGVVPHAHYQK